MLPEAKWPRQLPKLSAKKLTKRSIDSAKLPDSGDRFLWDSEIRGFGLRLYATGTRTFLFQYRAPQAAGTRRIAIGEYPSITVEQARSVARSAAGQLADGKDPKGSDSDVLQRRTLGEVFPEYLAERLGKLAPRTAAEYERMWAKTIAPAFGAKRFAALDEGTVARWHAARSATPTLANRAVDLLSAFCFWAERRGYREKHSNPCVDVERFEEQHKGRSLTQAEYQRLGESMRLALMVGIAAAPQLRRAPANAKNIKHRPKNADQPKRANPIAVAALRFLTLSGWREQEALSLRWDSLNLERGVAVLADTKSGRSERALGAVVIALVRAQKRLSGNPFVFPGERPGAHLADPKRLWQSLKHAAHLEETQPLRLHDLRHSYTTAARDELGLGDHVIARLVGHKISGMTSRYGEVRDATLRNAANSISQTIDNYLGPQQSTVLPFTRKSS